MNISMQLAAVLVVAACICLADGAPDGRLVRTKQQRPTRGFKNVEMMTARGFGKRDKSNIKSDQEEIRVTRGTFRPNSNILIARGYGKRSEETDGVLNADDFSEILGPAPEKEIMETTDDKTADSMPVELFVMEMLNHPELARSVVNKFIDLDQDGMLSLEELFRNRA